VTYYLGIDGGGSKTTCAIGDELSQLATAVAGPSNITRVGESRARESLHQAIRDACATAQIVPQQIQRACIGVAGAGREDVATVVRNIVAEVIGGDVEVVGDMPIALEAAFGKEPGVIVIAGTGSIAYGRDAQGMTARAGGWGYAISDEGSAHWIGRTAVSALLRDVDQNTDLGKNAQSTAEASLLFRELKAVWNVHSIDEFVRTANSNSDFAGLFPAVMTAADAGDALAQEVLKHAGRELAGLVRILVRRLFAEDRESLRAIPLAIAGGVFRHSPGVREVFCDEVRSLDRSFRVNPQVVEPVLGALEMARTGGCKD
jgi:glucosamine kinase